MPKRVIDGEALWNSSKLLRVRNFAWQDRYPRLIPLAMANGTFEADPYRVHQQVFGMHRSDVSPEEVAEMLNEYERVGLLFRWMTKGKVWGRWAGNEKTGRLPGPGRLKQKGEKLGEPNPEAEYEEYLTLHEEPEDCTPWDLLRRDPSYTDRIRPLSDRGTDRNHGFGSGKGNGTGGGSADAPKSTAPVLSPSPKAEPRPTPAAPEKKSPYITPPMFRAKPKAPAAAPQPAAPAPEPPQPAPAGDFLWSDEGLSDTWGPVDLLMDLADDFDAEPIFGYDLATCRRAVLHAWRGDYWPKQKINGTASLKRALKTLVSQIPATFDKVPTAARGPLHLPDPNCATCEGTGQAGVEPNEGYDFAPEMRTVYPQAVLCTCWQPIGQPWRDWVKEQRSPGGEA